MFGLSGGIPDPKASLGQQKGSFQQFWGNKRQCKLLPSPGGAKGHQGEIDPRPPCVHRYSQLRRGSVNVKIKQKVIGCGF